ncbi:hypothetical protein P280DRAFT_212497 [Massarina eburnea CBS 473.64]|uniref:Uncharacterized protein n=1 Tax=Massarina eburnea CBS 473.64 TaxID=1395130 RepID=A0A6A6RH44_9PLEO|nr:hypothetical protein P280DRAFT_212497 [Massarina eburnea CBS 473.64]
MLRKTYVPRRYGLAQTVQSYEDGVYTTPTPLYKMTSRPQALPSWALAHPVPREAPDEFAGEGYCTIELPGTVVPRRRSHPPCTSYTIDHTTLTSHLRSAHRYCAGFGRLASPVSMPEGTDPAEVLRDQDAFACSTSDCAYLSSSSALYGISINLRMHLLDYSSDDRGRLFS